MNPTALEAQQRKDILGIVVTGLLTVVIAPVGALPVGLIAWLCLRSLPGEPAMYLTQGAYMTAMAFGLPLWAWLALKLRRRLDWPKGAFRRVDY